MAEPGDKTELVVGAFVALGLALLAGLVLLFGNVRDLFRETYPLSVTFPSAGELSAKSHVRLGGARVGTVAGAPRLNEAFDGVTVELEIYEGVSVPEGAEFEIGASGLMGDAYVEITPPAEVSGRAIEPGATVEGAGLGGLSSLSEAAGDLSAEAKETLRALRATLAKLDRAIDKVSDGVLADGNVEALASALDRFDSALEKLDTGFLSETNATAFEATLGNLEDAAEQVREGAARVAPLLEKAEEAVGRAGPALDRVAEAAAGLEDAAGGIKEVADGVTAGDGTVAALLGDPQVRRDFEAFVRNLRRHGPLFYRDSAAAEAGAGPEQEGGGASRPAPPTAGARRPGPGAGPRR